MFDIHKVKPVHGWREFFGEVGIIVLGVLIALGLEQVAEAVHWHRKVGEATDALRQSVAVHTLAAIEQQVVAPCVDRQLDALEARLFAPGAFRPVRRYTDPHFVTYVVRAPSRPWEDSVWSTVTGEGTSTHFAPEFRNTMDHFYSALIENREVAREVDRLGGRLNAMSLPIARDPVTLSLFARDIEEFRSKEAYLTLISGQVLAHAEQARMIPPKDFIHQEVYERSGTIRFCRDNRLPLSRPLPISTQPLADRK